MNRELTPIPFRTRALLAAASAVLTTLVLGSVVGLADHYGALAELASAAQQVVAQR